MKKARNVKEEIVPVLGRIAEMSGKKELAEYYIIHEIEEIKIDEKGYRGVAEKYKATKDNSDADVSLFSMVCYALAFPYILVKTSKQEEGKHKDERKMIRRNVGKKYEIMFSDNNVQIAFHGDTMNSFKIITEKADELGASEEKIENYAKWVYTIGNFMPVPHLYNGQNCGSFNCARYFCTKDFWDLALHWIYKWYHDNKKEHLISLVGKKDSHIDACKYWLERFKGWKDFVKQNYLQGFVTTLGKDENGEEQYGKPIEFWLGHFDEGALLPTTKEQCEEFLEKVPHMIEERGKKIAEALQEKLESVSESEYENIADKLTSADGENRKEN